MGGNHAARLVANDLRHDVAIQPHHSHGSFGAMSDPPLSEVGRNGPFDGIIQFADRFGCELPKTGVLMS